MPPGFEPFLAAVCAAPWDDLPRLVFADWLDDHGRRPRAEVIRLQCAGERGGPTAAACRGRADKLFRRHGRVWLAELPPLEGVRWTASFRRGFPWAVAFHSESVPRRLATLAGAAPVESVRVYAQDRTGFGLLVASPLVAGLTRLQAFHADDTGAEALAANPAAGRLERLVLTGAFGYGVAAPSLTDRAAAALVRSPGLGALNWLRLIHAAVSPTLRAALADRFGRRIVVTPP